MNFGCGIQRVPYDLGMSFSLFDGFPVIPEQKMEIGSGSNCPFEKISCKWPRIVLKMHKTPKHFRALQHTPAACGSLRFKVSSLTFQGFFILKCHSLSFYHY